MAAPVGLARRTLTGRRLFFFGVSASAPMTVLVGGVMGAYAATGVVGVPLAFLLVTAALGLACVSYVAMSGESPHAGPLYAQVARGLGPVSGLSAAAVALLSYNAINVCLYPLLGATLADALGGVWWVWALVAWALVGVLGVAHINVNAVLLTVLLVVEIAVVVAFDAAALTHPAPGGLSWQPLTFGALFAGGDGTGLVFALAVASFIGAFDTAPAYAEEARSTRAVRRATFASLISVGVLYVVSAWAVTAVTGVGRVVEASAAAGGELPFQVLRAHYPGQVWAVAKMLLVTSIFAAMLSFHHCCARYTFALGRERALPIWFARVGDSETRSGVPVAGSLTQSVVALVAIVVCAASGADPATVLFPVLATVAALGVMALMVACCLAAIVHYQRGGGAGRVSVWVRVIAPFCGMVAVGAACYATVDNLGTVLGDAVAPWVLPVLIAGVAVVGMVWAVCLRGVDGDAYDRVGVGEPEPLAQIEPSFAHIKL